MAFLIDPYIRKYTEDLSFIHLKEDAQINIKGYLIPSGGLDVPLLTHELAENIKTKKENEVITVAAIIRGMAYTIGIDSGFKYATEYIKFLKSVDDNIEKFILVEAVKLAEDSKLAESLIFIKSVLVLNETNPQALLNYGISLLKYAEEKLSSKKEIKVFRREAKDKLEALLEIQPDPVAYYQLAYIYKDEKQFKRAQLYAEKLLDLEVDELLQARVKHMLYELEDLVKYEIGYEAILQGNTEAGLPLLLELEEKYPEWWNLIFFIGLGYRQAKEYNEAIEKFEAVLVLKEDMLDSIVELGLCYSSKGNYLEAIDYFKKALEVGGENSEILCNLAMAHMELGDYQEADYYIKTSLELNPHDEITQACEKQIKALMAE
ncbi:tetratricopeptide repeat protein [Alkaliphilus transvaalensis]|uniref:tetratricopeptide repeat protein n=1 Tax=Alkaliphilus transvaalensis TaxID=114628 RepID=UPI00047A085E|nr:tetratricopeptide repeat protein [Alkaliphilus transvaalensis]